MLPCLTKLFVYNNFILVLQNNLTHSTLNRLKWEKQILPSVGFESTTFGFASDR